MSWARVQPDRLSSSGAKNCPQHGSRAPGFRISTEQVSSAHILWGVCPWTQGDVSRAAGTERAGVREARNRSRSALTLRASKNEGSSRMAVMR